MSQRRAQAIPVPANLGALRRELEEISRMPDARVISVIPEPYRTVTFLDESGKVVTENVEANYLIIYDYDPKAPWENMP